MRVEVQLLQKSLLLKVPKNSKNFLRPSAGFILLEASTIKFPRVITLKEA